MALHQLGHRPQFLADHFGLVDQHLHDPIFRAVFQQEVLAPDLRGALEFAVDPAVALLQLAGVPGDVEVNEVFAMVLQVHAFAGGVGGNQDP